MNININSVGRNDNDTISWSMKMNQGTDAISKNLQTQIANAQKQIQNLGENKDISPEEKMKKRQEIQKQISDLQNQLRQHQIEQRNQSRQKSTSMDDMLGGQRQYGNNTGSSMGLSNSSMQVIISADSAMSQTKVQGAVRSQMEGQAHVLKGEIKMEESRGGNVEKLKERLAEIESKVQDIGAFQMKNLSDINHEMSQTATVDISSDGIEKYKESLLKASSEGLQHNENGEGIIFTEFNTLVGSRMPSIYGEMDDNGE